MASASKLERGPLHGTATKVEIHLWRRMRRAFRHLPTCRRLHVRTMAERLAPARRLLERILHLGVNDAQSVDTQKRIRLCNINAFGGAVIMVAWLFVEAAFGDLDALPWELGFLAGFVGVLALNGSGVHR